MKEYYRLIDEITEYGVRVRVETLRVYKTTPCGVWVIRPFAPAWWDFKTLRRNRYVKFILNSSGRKYCHPTIGSAIESFKRRKNSQLSKLIIQMEQCDKVLAEFQRVTDATLDDLKRGVVLGTTPSIQELTFL